MLFKKGMMPTRIFESDFDKQQKLQDYDDFVDSLRMSMGKDRKAMSLMP